MISGHAGTVLFLSFLFFAQVVEARPTVKAVRSGEHLLVTRLVIDLSQSTNFKVSIRRKPDRILIDFSSLSWLVAPEKTFGVGLVASYQFRQLDKNTSRVVLKTRGPVRIERSFLLPPKDYAFHRFVIDISRAAQASNSTNQSLSRRATLKKSSAVPLVEQKYSSVKLPHFKPKVPAVVPVRTIVIDPGHGGIDPGAVGLNGTLEKDITLAAALALKSSFEATNRYRVILTRSEDIFLKLRERVQIAQDTKADLFISLHADSLRDPHVRGGSVYTLSEKASDKEAEALANRENRSDLIGVKSDLDREDDDVAKILISLVQRETMNQSLTFATQLIPHFRRVGKILRKSRREAAFVVLKAPDVPSVLIEMGFLSNKNDEKKLKSRRFLKQLADAIVSSADAYFSALN